MKAHELYTKYNGLDLLTSIFDTKLASEYRFAANFYAIIINDLT